ncbi:MAG: aminoacyl-tRNA hydrolase [Oscillospiraceae bacterium]|nr:aminoacyl-tRNA hydrolase [Oscillospiraceae bacterium]
MADIFELFERIKKKDSATVPAGPVEWIVACLGNPGSQYDGTRHNVGFAAADYAARERGFSIQKLKFQALCGECMIGGKKVLFLKPSTYMNLSGQSVVAAMQFHKVPIERVIVIHDDVSMAPGRLRIRKKGSAGGHNGLKNIIYLTGKDTFPRIKVGVGEKPHPDYDMADWVLSRPNDEDRKLIENAVINANKALDLIIADDIDGAMSRFNK